MEGVEILSKNLISILDTNYPFVISVLCVWIAIICIMFYYNPIRATVFTLVAGIVLVLPLCTMSRYSKTKTEEYMEYLVTISDEVNFNEFNNKYEIISQEGKIYTIKEREDN